MTVEDCTAAAAAADAAAGDGGPCQQRLERHLAAATAARAPSLVLLRGAERCDSDRCFDAALGILERFVDPNERQPVLTKEGAVRAALAAIVVVAAPLSAERCASLRLMASRELRLQAAAELEAMWPSSRFSYGVRVAKRALINRLGGSAAVACG
uniref:Uncharacterized protein n=2 Tax=Emiliania huxleyi TaxID=2903 RepID=A0A6V2T5E9_EMIHU